VGVMVGREISSILETLRVPQCPLAHIGAFALQSASWLDGMAPTPQHHPCFTSPPPHPSPRSPQQVTSVFCTIYYLAYMATSAILLLNLLIAMIIRTYNASQKLAESHWRRRWALWVPRCGPLLLGAAWSGPYAMLPAQSHSHKNTHMHTRARMRTHARAHTHAHSLSLSHSLTHKPTVNLPKGIVSRPSAACPRTGCGASGWGSRPGTRSVDATCTGGQE
jgi:hypothetical protein